MVGEGRAPGEAVLELDRGGKRREGEPPRATSAEGALGGGRGRRKDGSHGCEKKEGVRGPAGGKPLGGIDAGGKP